MAIFDIKLPASIARALNIPVSDVRRQQIKVLKKLLRKARFTEFGQKFLFDEILLARHPGKISTAGTYLRLFKNLQRMVV